MMISRQNYGLLSFFTLLLVSLFAVPNQIIAQQRYRTSPVGASAPGRLQPAYMPPQNYSQGSMVQTGPESSVYSQANYYPNSHAVSAPANRYEHAEQMVNTRTPRRNDIMAIDQHTLFQYRRVYRNGSTPQPHELLGQWNGVNKGIVEIAGYRQFVKDIQIGGNGQFRGDNIQVGQVKLDQLRLDGWQRKFDYQASDYLRRGSFAVQAPSGRGAFGHGVTFSYADGNNPHNDPARLLVDEVVKVDGNHMIGRAVAKFGPIKIPLAYFVLEKRE